MAKDLENGDWIDLTLARRHEWINQLSTFTFSGWDAPFTAGQYVTLADTINGEMIERHYSVASAPGTPLELYLTMVPDGALTPRLFAMAPGDKLKCWPQPRGKFTLNKVPASRDLWLVGTGTGLAPFLSMLRSGTPWAQFEHVVLVHSVRAGCDLGYGPELAAMVAASNGRLRYVPATSRENFAGAIEGRITTALREGTLEAAAGLSLQADLSQVMLCGNPAMLDEMKSLLDARAMPVHRKMRPGNVHLEKYW
mgnify:CR=1 FL=1